METATRTSYHHGDLRSALIETGLELTRAGGPDALGIREATRRIGVTARDGGVGPRRLSDRYPRWAFSLGLVSAVALVVVGAVLVITGT